MNEETYKGYSIITSTTSIDGRSFGPTVFSVRAKFGEHGDPVHRGMIQETFSNDRDAHNAAVKLARKWIDEQVN